MDFDDNMHTEMEVDSSNTADDTISVLEFSQDGNYLATGDHSGRVSVLKIDTEVSSGNKMIHDTESTGSDSNWLPYVQFLSHDPEFDYLKSLEIEARINQLKFCSPVNNNNFLLSTNDKTIKLWKLGPSIFHESNSELNYYNTGKFTLPIATSSSIQARTKKIFSNAHTYHINSLALCSDMETFFSADDLRINMWKLDNNSIAYNIIDIKPDNMEELTEVITALQCHPIQCNTFLYSSSRGVIKVCDTRTSALCSKSSKVFSDQSMMNTNKYFITDILNSISDVTYTSDGKYIITRDYLSIKIWDVQMEKQPIKTILLHEYLRPILYDLYSSDIIYDKFEVCCSANGTNIATGSYNNQLKVIHQDKKDIVKSIDLPQSSNNSSSLQNITATKTSTNSSKPATNSICLDEKILHCAWHPSNNTVAVAGKSGLCLYNI